MPIDIDIDCMRQKNNIIVSKGWYLKNVLGDQSLVYIAWGRGEKQLTESSQSWGPWVRLGTIALSGCMGIPAFWASPFPNPQ